MNVEVSIIDSSNSFFDTKIYTMQIFFNYQKLLTINVTSDKDTEKLDVILQFLIIAIGEFHKFEVDVVTFRDLLDAVKVSADPELRQCDLF